MITLLDGAMGTELRDRGVEVPDHTTSIWSAKALLCSPEAIVQVHRDYIAAGADVISTNNYAVTPPLLAREELGHRVEELTERAVDLAIEARASAGRDVRLAGSVPPLHTSYRADLVGPEDRLLAHYRRIVHALGDRVDILLCETMSCAREARAAVTVARETDREVWVAWTLQGNRPGRLPSGETVREAFDALRPLDADAYLVNCCGANFVADAIRSLSSLCDRPVGGYANSSEVVPGEFDPLHPEQYESRELDADAYVGAAREWIAAGATIVGGCCHTTPAHIARLRSLIDSLDD